MIFWQARRKKSTESGFFIVLLNEFATSICAESEVVTHESTTFA